jgi:hypothetical protein
MEIELVEKRNEIEEGYLKIVSHSDELNRMRETRRA